MPGRPKKPRSEPEVALGARVPKSLANRIKLAAVQRSVSGQEPATVRGIVAQALEQWLARYAHQDK